MMRSYHLNSGAGIAGPFGEAAAAYTHYQSGNAFGKVVISVDESG